MIISKGIHVAANGIILFFFMAEWYSIVYMHHIYFILSSVNGCLGCFYVFLIHLLLLSHVGLFATPWTAACQASLSFTISLSLFKLMSIESVIPSNLLILCHLLLPFLQSFPASGSFPMGQLLGSSDQSIKALASVLPMDIQG